MSDDGNGVNVAAGYRSCDSFSSDTGVKSQYKSFLLFWAQH